MVKEKANYSTKSGPHRSIYILTFLHLKAKTLWDNHITAEI
ncbi:hypothetical protein [Alloprevotella tannerae]